MRAKNMTWGIPTETFLLIHVLLSLVGIASGFVVLWGLIANTMLPRWTALFLASTVLTSITGFPLPPFGFDPPRAIGIISLALLALAVVGLYAFRLKGGWRWVYVLTALSALYLNVFVAVVQSFQKLPFLSVFAPTQSEPPFVVVQVAFFVAFVVLGALALRRFHPETRAAA
jgi:hypothetical protein